MKLHSQVLLQEAQNSLVPVLVLLHHLGVIQIAPRGHPPVDHLLPRLDMLLALQVLLKLRHIVLALVSAGQQHMWDRDLRRIRTAHTSRVQLYADRPRGVLLRRKRNDLSAPAVPDSNPLLDLRRLLLEAVQESVGLLARLGEVAVLLKPVSELVGCGGGGRVPFAWAGVVVEEVGDEDAVGGGGGEDVGALEGLGVVSEDVGDDEDADGGVGGAGDVCKGLVGWVWTVGGRSTNMS